MRLFRLLGFAAAVGFALCSARAADPVTIELKPTVTVGTALVTVGDIATVTGGDEVTRLRVARIDLVELKPRELSTTVGQKSVEYRLLLAGFDPSAVKVTGAERTTAALARRPVTAEEVAAVARDELLRHYPNPESFTVELAAPIVVKLPEVPVSEKVAITAKPRGKAGALGRVQMDMGVSAAGQNLLSFAVYLNVQSLNALAPLAPLAPVPPAASAAPAAAPAAGTAFASAELLIRPRQRVDIQVNSGAIRASVPGEAQQGGKLGQTILVQNIDSKKTVSARVTGPGTVEVDLGGNR